LHRYSRKTIWSDKRKVIDGKHILTTPEIFAGLIDAEEKGKEKEDNWSRKGERIQVAEESSDDSEASQDESLVILDCIEVE
jgi:hypothetical protein